MRERELQKLIRAGAGGDDFDPALHGRIVAALKEFEPSALSLTTRFQAAGYLQRAVTYLAHQNDYKRPSPYAQDDFVVDEEKFPEETGILTGISATLQYSNEMANHFEGRRRSLIQSLNSKPIFSVAPPWNTLSEQAKLSLLNEFMKRSVEIHSLVKGENRIISLLDDQNHARPYARSLLQISKREDGIQRTGAAVKFSKKVLGSQTHRRALILAYHESVHIVSHQIALDLNNGDIPPAHPLYNDARIRRASLYFGPAESSCIASLYESDSEEKLAYGEQEAFIREAAAFNRSQAKP